MIEVASYEKSLKKENLNSYSQKSNKKFWINLTNPTEEELRKLKETFNLHEATIEDLKTAKTRPKIEEFDKYLFLTSCVIKIENNVIKPVGIQFILGKNYLITCKHYHTEILEDIKKQELKISEKLNKGPDFLLQYIIETTLRNYFPKLEHIDLELDKLESQALVNPSPQILEKILKLKRELQKLRKIIHPQREIFNSLSSNKYINLSPAVKIYFRDLYDHMAIITELLEDYREATSNIMEVNLAVTSNKLNEVMKVLTVIATVLMPLTLIASIYGMNFDYMPELTWRYGYFLVLGIMLLVLIITVLFLKKKKWI